MGFSWRNTSLKNKIITKDQIGEMRGNIDSIKNNIACLSKNSSVHSDNHSGLRSCNSKHGTYKSGLDSTYNSSRYFTQKATDNTTVNSSTNTGYVYCGTKYYPNYASQYGTYASCSTKYGTDYSAKRSTVYWDH